MTGDRGYDTYRGDQKETQWELDDMEADRTELNDLAKEMPDKLGEMVGKCMPGRSASAFSRGQSSGRRKNTCLPKPTITNYTEP
jgi:hypothetical protein